MKNSQKKVLNIMFLKLPTVFENFDFIFVVCLGMRKQNAKRTNSNLKISNCEFRVAMCG